MIKKFNEFINESYLDVPENEKSFIFANDVIEYLTGHFHPNVKYKRDRLLKRIEKIFNNSINNKSEREIFVSALDVKYILKMFDTNNDIQSVKGLRQQDQDEEAVINIINNVYSEEFDFDINEAKKVDTDTYKNLNVKSMIQVVDADDKNNGNAKITKKSKTLYYISWHSKKWKVKIEDVSINVHGQAQVDEKDLIKMK